MIRCAIVGLGWWGRVMVEATQTSERIRFTHACVRRPDAAAGFAARYSLRLLESLEALLQAPDIDAVALATPHSQHVAQIAAAAAAGKHVFSEKPLALDLAQARIAVDACAGVVLGLGTDRRMLPAVRRLATLLAEGALGALLHVEAQYSNNTMTRGLSGAWRDAPGEAPAAGMTGPGLHALDLLLSLAGPLAQATGQLHRPFGEAVPTDAASLLLRFAGGATGTLGCVRGVPDHFRLSVFGTGGWAEIRDFGDLHVQRAGAPRLIEEHPRGLAVGPLLDCFADAVAGKAPFPVSPTAMLQTVAAFEAAVAALASGLPVRVAEA